MEPLAVVVLELGVSCTLIFFGGWMAGSPGWWASHVQRFGSRSLPPDTSSRRLRGIRLVGVLLVALAGFVFVEAIVTMIRARAG
jgi:hypothetical protein